MKRITREELKLVIEISSLINKSNKSNKNKLSSIFFEDADPSKINPKLFPKKLSQVDKQVAQSLVDSGLNDGKKEDDRVGSIILTISAKKLKPSQSTMRAGQAVSFAIGSLVGAGPMSGGPGGNLDAVISKDYFIMDGHHRWIATLMIKPEATVTGTQVMLPAEQLVAVLNAVTAGKYGRGGQGATGGFDQFTKENIKSYVLDSIKKGDKNFSGEDAKKGLIKFTNSEEGVSDEDLAEKTAEKMMKNIESNPDWKTLPNDPNERADMPVINKDEVKSVANSLKQGEVDVNPPYSDETKKSSGINDSRIRKNNLIVERWQRLAGIKEK